METNNKKLESKKIYGKGIRTNNSSMEPIMDLWGEFMQKKHKGDIYAVYTNYESDFMGDYDFYIATEESSNEFELIIPDGDYIVIDVDASKPNNQGVGEAWNYIWNSDIKRAYKTDFELYGADGTIKIYLSI